MRVLRVIKEPAEILHLPTKEVPMEELQLPTIQSFIDDMLLTLSAVSGIGLAAPQVDSNARIAVIGVTKPPTVLVNPMIVKSRGMTGKVEGCLSLPGQRYHTRRFRKVWVKAVGRYGQQVNFNGVTGKMAHVLQHEIDHLDGILCSQRVG